MSRIHRQTRGPGGPDEDQQDDELKDDGGRCLNKGADRRIRLAGPGAEGGMRDVGFLMMPGMRLFERRAETAGCADRQSQIESRHADGEWNKTPPHFASLSTCCNSATASGLSHSRGPTARPTCLPSWARSTVVGRPRTINLRETS